MSFAWIVGLRECVSLCKELPQTRQVCVMEREADVFKLFVVPRQSERPEKSKQKARTATEQRTTNVQLRHLLGRAACAFKSTGKGADHSEGGAHPGAVGA